MIVDASVLFAAANRRDGNHGACRSIVMEGNGPLIIPALVVAEASYLIGRTIGAAAETAFVRSLGSTRFAVVGPTREDLRRMGSLTSTYEDLPLGATDASILALAERLGDTAVATLDRRHFTVVTASIGPLTLFPEILTTSR